MNSSPKPLPPCAPSTRTPSSSVVVAIVTAIHCRQSVSWQAGGLFDRAQPTSQPQPRWTGQEGSQTCYHDRIIQGARPRRKLALAWRLRLTTSPWPLGMAWATQRGGGGNWLPIRMWTAARYRNWMVMSLLQPKTRYRRGGMKRCGFISSWIRLTTSKSNTLSPVINWMFVPPGNQILQYSFQTTNPVHVANTFAGDTFLLYSTNTVALSSTLLRQNVANPTAVESRLLILAGVKKQR